VFFGVTGGGWWYAHGERFHAAKEAELRKQADANAKEAATNAELYRGQRDAAEQERNRARLAEDKAKEQRDAALLSAYAADVHLAQREWETGSVGRALELLQAHGQDDLRGFE